MNEIINQRSFNVPGEILFKAWSQAEHIKNWWGPDGFTNTFYEFDFRNGGHWRFTMHGPDGKDYENESMFEIIKENELIMLHHLSKPEYRAEFIFSSNDNNSSSLVWKMVFTTDKAYEALKNIVPEKNEENLNRLEAALEKIKIH
ncbi:MAG: SRPBCC domain-containing protein [Sphingobacteriales bacterium]|nr:SRPBCC domain-containing protein [Sphingobacteriales bacterium]